MRKKRAALARSGSARLRVRLAEASRFLLSSDRDRAEIDDSGAALSGYRHVNGYGVAAAGTAGATSTSCSAGTP